MKKSQSCLLLVSSIVTLSILSVADIGSAFPARVRRDNQVKLGWGKFYGKNRRLEIDRCDQRTCTVIRKGMIYSDKIEKTYLCSDVRDIQNFSGIGPCKFFTNASDQTIEINDQDCKKISNISKIQIDRLLIKLENENIAPSDEKSSKLEKNIIETLYPRCTLPDQPNNSI
ncbi:MAG: hypothetical protein HCA25_14300 [Dolichospermum sp. DET50]|nr:hypothetical protein [Dolichospermum sp. DET66]MBS3033409.1 hypothetical protein [Dolichospermum sp. DET67]MBS3038613.1 hypothetical protein [Dolichospermum sp. DET50]QSX65895.1 MAG: hypothetical protein EZY12_13550 [Dolichospermum sp. DET69]